MYGPRISEVAGTVRRARARASSGSSLGGGEPSSEPFGTLLMLHNRPFLSELWPELACVPMDLKEESDASAPVPRAECSRLMEILLDFVSLESSTTTRHLLDSDFSGGFTPTEAALKGKLTAFRDSLGENELARQSSGFAVVGQTLRRLGDLRSYRDDDLDDL